MSESESLVGCFVGRYRIEESLGRGGMAEVYRAYDERLERDVALKMILPAHASDQHYVQRFLREAKVVASLEHPSILPVFDFGEHENNPYLVMPLVGGGSLADRLSGQGLTPEAAAFYLWQLGEALDGAHKAGVLHRDIKPGNALLGVDDRIYLADFGIARLGGGATALTQTGMVVGTPIYMAPEIAAGMQAKSASDRYSLAVLGYEMLAGEPPFSGENVLSILHQHTSKEVPAITKTAEQLPQGLDSLFAKGLAKNPDERFDSCREFASALATELNVAIPLPRPSGPALDIERTLELQTPPSQKAPRSKSRRPWMGIAAAALVGTILALVGLVELRQDDDRLSGETELIPASEGLASIPSESQSPVGVEPEEEQEPLSEPSVEDGSATQTKLPTVDPKPTPAASTLAEARPASHSEGPVAIGSPGPRGRGPFGSKILRFEQILLLRSRPTRQSFESMLNEARAAFRKPGALGPKGDLVERYAGGGLDYLDGNDDRALRILRTLVTDTQSQLAWSFLPLMVLRIDQDSLKTDWGLALGYGDPRRTAGDDLDLELAKVGRSVDRLLARACIHRLDGEAEAVVDLIDEAQARLSPNTPGLLVFASLMRADAYLTLGLDAHVRESFGSAIEDAIGHEALERSVVMYIVRTFTNVGDQTTRDQLLGRLCDRGQDQACRILHRRRLPAR